MACFSLILLIIISSFSSLNSVSQAQNDTLKPGQLLRDYEQLTSPGGVFKLGFFSPDTELLELGSAGPRYLGIWFVRIPFYSVWVANRANPVPDSSGALMLDNDGKLKITYQGGAAMVINSNQVGNASSGNMIASLLDSGNLVVRRVDSDGKAGPVLWQSFDYPHNILLPGMKIGMNLRTGQNWSLTSWLSEQIPAPGVFRLGLDPTGANQLVIWRRGDVYWSSGVWQNGSFQSAPGLTKRRDIYDFKFVSNEEEKYFTYSIKQKSIDSILSSWDLDRLGEITVFTLETRGNTEDWILETMGPCETGTDNSSAVCLTEKPSKCRNSAYFMAKRGLMDGYDFWSSDSDQSLALSDCHAKCWNNCSCVAYSSFGDGIGCQYWSKGAKFIQNDNVDFVYLLTHQGRQRKGNKG